MSLVDRIIKIEVDKQQSNTVNVQLNKYGFLDILSDDAPFYDVEDSPYLINFLNDQEYPRKIVIGPYGSGKTSGIINTILRDAVLMPKCDDGIRKSKVAIIRNTMGQLETTTLQTALFWTRGLPKPRSRMKPKMVYNYKFNDEFGEIRLELLFLALDSENAAVDLDSLEVSHAFFNELRHIPKSIFDKVNGRLPRYPSKVEYMKLFESEQEKNPELKWLDWRPFEPKVYADTNPPKNRHWIQTVDKEQGDSSVDDEFLVDINEFGHKKVIDSTNLKKKLKVYHQPPALLEVDRGKYKINDSADNLNYVGSEYYLEMIERGEEYIKVFAQGKYGTVVDGKAVYQGYIDDIHSKENIKLILNEMLYIGVDYGIVSPAILVAQCIGGQIRFIKEFLGEYETIGTLAKAELMPFLNTYCKGMKYQIVGDPANTGRGKEQLEELNLDVNIARTNDIEERVGSVSTTLDELRKGVPRISVSRAGCPVLREGFLGEYHYRRLKIVGEEKYVDTPNKTHPYSDVQDCGQYIVMDILSTEDGIDNMESYHRARKRWDEDSRSSITGY